MDTKYNLSLPRAFAMSIVRFASQVGLTGLLFAPSLYARQALVNVPGNYPTIQQAITDSTGDVIILIAPGTYSEELFVSRPHSVTLRGTGDHPSDTVLSPNTDMPGVVAAEFDTLKIENLEIYAGRADSSFVEEGGGVRATQGQALELERVLIRDCIASIGGSGLYTEDVASVSVKNCGFEDNAAVGGTIQISLTEPGETFHMDLSTVRNCSGLAGVFLTASAGTSGTLLVENSAFDNPGSWAVATAGTALTTFRRCLVSGATSAASQGTVTEVDLMFDDPLFEQGEILRPSPCSPLIDAADPTLPVGSEPLPNGQRANLGMWGTTELAQVTDALDIRVDSNNDIHVDAQDEEVEESQAFRFWINNDNDDAGKRDWKGGSPDALDESINTLRDLEDFAVLRLRSQCAEAGDELFLRFQASSGTPSIRMFRTIYPDGPNSPRPDYQFNVSIGRPLLDTDPVSLTTSSGGTTTVIGSDKVRIPSSLTSSTDAVILIFEGITDGEGQLIFSLERNGAEVATDSVRIELNDFQGGPSVDPGMYSIVSGRSGNLVTLYDNRDSPDQPVTAFVHGFNISEEAALRGWLPTVFKRLYWTGHQAHFAGYLWAGDWGIVPSATFHANVKQALISSDTFAPFANAFGQTNGGIDVLAHSAGNIVVADALRKWIPGRVRNFVSLQAAIPSNAMNVTVPRAVTCGILRHKCLWGSTAPLTGVAGVQHAFGVPNISPWTLNTFTIAGPPTAPTDLWGGLYQADLTASQSRLVHTWSAADRVLDLTYHLSQRLMPLPGTPSASVYDLLSYRHGAKSLALGVGPHPQYPVSSDMSPLGITSHSAMRDLGLVDVHRFYRRLILRDYVRGQTL